MTDELVVSLLHRPLTDVSFAIDLPDTLLQSHILDLMICSVEAYGFVRFRFGTYETGQKLNKCETSMIVPKTLGRAERSVIERVKVKEMLAKGLLESGVPW